MDLVGLVVVIGIFALLQWLLSRTSLRTRNPDLPSVSLSQVNQVLLFVVLAGVIAFALGIIRCEAVIRT